MPRRSDAPILHERLLFDSNKATSFVVRAQHIHLHICDSLHSLRRLLSPLLAPLRSPQITFRLLLYHCIMFLMSALHTTPDRHPFGVMLWSMRLIAIYAFFGDIYLLRLESVDPDREH